MSVALTTINAVDVVDGINSQAMQQGGLGLLLTTLIITAPPMAAMFFQGTLGGFSAYATMGPHLTQQGGGGAPGGHPGNAGGAYAQQQPGQNTNGPGVGAMPSRVASALATHGASEGQGTFGAANKPDRE